ncbi:MAG: hypothetical protein N2314_07290 [Brevinematales bacterium]|nr:hypothetical protein [Brevinematales bacterium]
MKNSWKIGVLFLASTCYSLSVGGRICLLFPENAPPAVEYALFQDIKLPAGFFVGLGGMYYRLFGIGFEDNRTPWGMFSGDMVGGMVSAGWQYQGKKWQAGFSLSGGIGELFGLELREHVARSFLHAKEGTHPLVVSSETKEKFLLGWGIATELRHQWNLFSVGILLGWLDMAAQHSLTLKWQELSSGTLTEREKTYEGLFTLKGIRMGLSFHMLL